MKDRRCPRCGKAFSLDVPAKGRRLCDTCRAKRATFFVCPGCGVERETRSATRDDQRRPVQCWDCRQAGEAVARTAWLVAHVARLEPGLEPEAIEAAVATAAPSRVERKWLVEHLGAHPDALSSAACDASRVLGRLAHVLIAAGATGVALPICALCSRPAVLVTVGTDGRICATCDRDGRADGCGACGQVRRVYARLPDGRAVCRTCRLGDPATHESCSYCGRRRRINARTQAGGAVCSTCYGRHLQRPRRCDGCGGTAIITATTGEGRSLCQRCYSKPQRECGRCGRVGIISVRARDGQPDLCHACNWAAVAVCTRCGVEGPGVGVRRGEHVCLRCISHQRLVELITGPDGRILDGLAGLRDAFFAAHQPRSIFVWLDRSPGARVLARLAAGELDLTHAALDGLAQTPSLHHLRQLLVATGALPERDPYMARLERAATALAASLEDPDDARLLSAYARWRVLYRVRRRASENAITANAGHNARDTIAEAARFLAWLRGHGRGLGECRQADVDAWLTQRPQSRRDLRPLIGWAAERGLVARLEVPGENRELRPQPVDDQARWELARRLLHGEDLDPADRVVGALVVLYAQPLTRIAQLRLGDIVDVDGEVRLSFGKDQVHMPGPLGDLLRQLPWRRQVGPSGSVPGASEWLFPGRQAGRHQHPEYLSMRLRAAGIGPRALRSAALLSLGRQIAPAVLADLLNLHPNTAVRWVKAANGDWANYAAARVRTDAINSEEPK